MTRYGRYQRLITQWAHGVTAISDLNANVCDRIFSLEVQPALGDARSAQQAIERPGYRSRGAGARALLGAVILAVGREQAYTW